MIDGAGGRAFCAGGDIRAGAREQPGGPARRGEAFFTAEYALNQAIADYPKPFVALIDGICMGGGIGVSVHGSARVATEAAMFAMPETGIALFPDVGATFLLPRLRGEIGMYMALTGARLHGADAAYAGLATHFADRETIAALPAALAADGAAVLAGIARPFDAPIAPHMEAIDHCFGADSVAGIVATAERDRHGVVPPDPGHAARHVPECGALDVPYRPRRRGRTLPQCLAAELALTRHVTQHPDFAEGVRAMVVDKDRQPRWSPARLEDVSPTTIEAMFA